MKRTQLFTKTSKTAPSDEVAKNAELLIRAGFIHKEMAGAYAYLPLGLRTLEKIKTIIREEMNAIGGQELLMTTLQPKDLWERTNRWDDKVIDNWFKTKLANGSELGVGLTHEEPIVQSVGEYVNSYRDLPLLVYQISPKFRNELRAKSGMLRGREFLMKDAYSFDLDQAGARHSYNKMFVAYLRTFARLGLKSIPMVADTGPIGGNLSHEFIILASTGESEVFCHKDYLDFPVPPSDVNFDDVSGLQGIVDKWTSLYAATSEKHEAAAFGAIPADKQVSARGIEVGHIFYFGTKYSEPMKAVVSGPDGVEKPVHMGSYGIGPTRLIAAIIEAFHDDAGIKWPEAVAPFKVAILNLKQGDSATDAACETLYRDLTAKGVDVLYHDLDERPGAKFATADLIGIPYQIMVGPRGLAEGKVELKLRADGSREMLSPDAAVARVAPIVPAVA
jgi:prolyl-tRNA synthetase